MDEGYESAVANCNSMAQLRKVAEKNPVVKDGSLDSVSPVKILISSVFQRLELNGKKIESFPAATVAEFWSNLKSVDASVRPDVKWVKAVLPEHPKIKQFTEHCCQLRHYSFCVKKCGKIDCTMCRPPRLPSDVFQEIKFLPDTIPNADSRYTVKKELSY